MKKFYGNYILISIGFFLLVSFLRGWFVPGSIMLFIGAAVGSLLPDLDSVVYVLYLKPQELASQRVKKAIVERNFIKAAELFYKTKDERSNLMFHSIFFQLIFIIFTYNIIISTSSFFGRGLAIAFLIHLIIDQYTDFKKEKHLNKWMHNFEYNLSKDASKIYMYSMFAVLLFFGLVV